MRTAHSGSSTRNGSTATRKDSSAPLKGAFCISISTSNDSATGVDFGFGVFGVLAFLCIMPSFAEMLKRCVLIFLISHVHQAL